jgi:hypothetical protein
VGREFSPSSGLLVLGFLQNSSGFNQLLSQLDEQLHDLLNGFMVNLGGQFGQGSDDGLEQSSVRLVFRKTLLNGFESGFQLCKGRSQSQVLDELDCIVNGGNSLIVFTVLPDPDIVLGVSIGFL